MGRRRKKKRRDKYDEGGEGFDESKTSKVGGDGTEEEKVRQKDEGSRKGDRIR